MELEKKMTLLIRKKEVNLQVTEGGQGLVMKIQAEIQPQSTAFLKHKSCSPAAITKSSLVVLKAVIASLRTPEGSQLHKSCLPLPWRMSTH